MINEFNAIIDGRDDPNGIPDVLYDINTQIIYVRSLKRKFLSHEEYETFRKIENIKKNHKDWAHPSGVLHEYILVNSEKEKEEAELLGYEAVGVPVVVDKFLRKDKKIAMQFKY